MQDKITIQGLKVPTTIGTLAFERAITQTLVLDIEFGIDASIAALEDDLQQTVDYDALSTYVIDFGAQSEYLLVETFAQTLANNLIEKFQIQDVKLRVKKPHAVKAAEFIAVTIERSVQD